MSGRQQQRGGCGVRARGQAAYAREFGNAQVKHTAPRQTANQVVHCQSKQTSCPKTEAFKTTQKK
jgi:hypothetical protein